MFKDPWLGLRLWNTALAWCNHLSPGSCHSNNPSGVVCLECDTVQCFQWHFATPAIHYHQLGSLQTSYCRKSACQGTSVSPSADTRVSDATQILMHLRCTAPHWEADRGSVFQKANFLFTCLRKSHPCKNGHGPILHFCVASKHGPSSKELQNCVLVPG